MKLLCVYLQLQKLHFLKLLYNIFIALYPVAARLISGKNAKAKLWTNGRRNIFEQLAASFQENKQPIVWMHCSSLGEFEQGRPVIEKLKRQTPNYKFLLTFFSPSGYEVRKNYAGADWIFYLPMDSKKNAQQFFDIVKPSLILFVKYEFWYYYLNEAKHRNIPLLLVSGIFRSQQIFFKWYGNFYKEMLHCFTQLFVQNEECLQLLNSIGIHKNVVVSGDTRFDRVIEIAEQFAPIQAIEAFVGNNQVIVAGSTWTEDDEELDHYANTHPKIKFIIAPHEIEDERIMECLSLYKNAVLFTDWELQIKDNPKQPSTPNVLIINNVGMLSQLYHYATICYVGGAFGDDGVHNVLEAAVYNKPVVFGPVFEKYNEAIELVDADGAISIGNALQLEKELDNLFDNTILYNQICANAGNYVKRRSGATNKIIQYIQEKRLLTN